MIGRRRAGARWVVAAPVGAVLLAVTGLTACSKDSTAPEPESACMSAMRTAVAARGPSEANRLTAATLSDCSTAEEWLEALREYHPTAMESESRAEIVRLELQVACMNHEDTPVCTDAADNGLL